MALGYDGKLYILAFDHRGSFQKKMFGIEGDPTPEETDDDLRRQEADLRGHGEGRRARPGRDSPPACWSTSSSAPTSRSSRQGARPVADDAGREERRRTSSSSSTATTSRRHIEKYDLLATKVLVRHNPDGDAEMNERQTERLKELADWLHANDRKFLFELLVPGRGRPARVRRRRHRPLRRRAAPRADAPRRSSTIQDAGVEVDIWKIEGVDTREDARDALRRRPARARAARTSRACSWAAARPTTRSTTGCARPRRSRASSASRSAARSGGTR